MRKNVASQVVCFQAVSTTDGSAVTAGTPTVYYTIDGGTQGTGAGTSTHEGNGCWSYVPAQAETNGNHVAFTFFLSGAVSQTVNIYPGSYDYTDSVRLGLTALPNAAADAAGGLPVSDAGGLDLDATVGALTFTVANKLDVNMLAISGDTTAADNLELQYDTTGLTGDTFPATQAQIGNIAIAGAAINTVAESYVLTTGSQTSGTYASTAALDGTTHQHTDTAGTMELYYQFDLGNDGVPTSCKIVGRSTGINDSLGVYAYNWAGTSWDQVGTLVGTASTTNETNTFDLLVAHVGTGSNVGKVRIRLYNTGLTTATLYVDQILCSYTQAAAGIANGSTITLGAATTNTNLIGRNWILALGGQDISGSYFYQSVNVSGTGTCTNGNPWVFQECYIATATLSACGFLENCLLGSTLTLTSTGGVTADQVDFVSCASAVAGNGAPHVDLSNVTKTTSCSFRRWSGGLQITLTAGCTVSVDVISGGTITVGGTGGAISIRGLIQGITDNSGGNVTITSSAALNKAFVNAECDTAISDAALATAASLATAQADLDIITGADGVNLLSATQASIDAIEADTNELQGDWANGGRLDLIVDAILVDTGTTLPASLATIDSNVDAILVDTGTTIPGILGTPAGADLATDIAANQTDLDAILVDLADGTVQVGTVRDGAIGAAAVADIFSTTTIAEAYAADGAAGTPAQILYQVQQALTEFAIASTTITVKKLDGSTTASTYTIDSATAPTSRTRAT